MKQERILVRSSSSPQPAILLEGVGMFSSVVVSRGAVLPPPSSSHVPASEQLSTIITSSAVVLELAEGGELYEQMIRKNVLDEATAKVYFSQMSSAIAHLHSRNICHRDLKPENVLLSSSEDQNPVLKLSDLGRPATRPS